MTTTLDRQEPISLICGRTRRLEKNRFVLIAAATLLLLVSAQASEPEEVYRHVTVLEDRVGKIYIRASYEVPLTVLVDCESNRRGCPEEQVYDTVLRLDFVSERRQAGKNEVFRTEEPAGTIHAALAFSQEDLETFRVELENQLRRLSAQAFMEPFAGWRPMEPGQHGRIQPNRGPFNSELPSPPQRPTWVCFESGGSTTVARFHREVIEGPTGEEEISAGSHTYGELLAPLCDEMAAATEGAYPTIVETLPVPRRLREVVVRHEEVARIDTENPEMLIPRPAGVQFFKQKAREGIMAAGSDDEEGVSYAVQVGAGWLRSGYASPTAMPIDALDRNAWLHRWTIETIERQLGPRPSERTIERTAVYATYLATVPAAVMDEEWSGMISSRIPSEPPAARDVVPDQPARIDRTAFVDEIVGRLDRHHGSPFELIEELLARPEVGLESEAWIAVLCHQDGTATYYLPPTKAQNAVVNADLFCAAVESRLRR